MATKKNSKTPKTPKASTPVIDAEIVNPTGADVANFAPAPVAETVIVSAIMTEQAPPAPFRQILALPAGDAKTPGKRFIPRTVEWNEEIFVSPLRTPAGKAIPGEFGVFAQSDETFLGRYARENHLVANTFLLDCFESAISAFGVRFNRSIFSLDYGAGMSAVYTFPDITTQGPDGKRIALRMRVCNSYNGKSKVCGVLEALRLICLNGMMGFGEVFNVSKRHNGAIDVPGIVQTVTPLIESGLSGIVAPMARLIELPMPQEQGAWALRNLFKANPLKFSGLMARRIESAWENPTEDEKDSHTTAWGLLNAATRTFRDMEGEKPELISRVAPFFTGALVGMTAGDDKAKDWQRRLFAPISREEAYKRDED
ncbi:MAG: DUF932 domain-containing protein [Proteobacteria bacterium]|nr:MAG: DUF932 domain-containing protein [Pseudomonadota bacterium]